MPVLTVFFELLKSFLFLLPLPLRDWASLVAQLVKNLPAMQEIQVRFLGLEDLLEKEIGNSFQYSCLDKPLDREAWQATIHGIVRIRHDLVTKPPPCCLDNPEKIWELYKEGKLTGSGRLH